jgi:hypothetical protein
MGAACLGRIYKFGRLVARQKTREFLTIEPDTGCCFGRVWMRIRDGRHVRQIQRLLHVHDADCEAALGAVHADFDDAVRSFGIHQQSSLVVVRITGPKNGFF